MSLPVRHYNSHLFKSSFTSFSLFQYTSPALILLDLHLLSFIWMIVNDIIFLISMSMYSLLVCRNTIDFCVSVVSCKLADLTSYFYDFFCRFLGTFYRQSCHRPIGNVLFLHFWSEYLFFFSSLITLARTSSTVFVEVVRMDILAAVLSILSPLSKILSFGFLVNVIYQVEKVSFYYYFSEFFKSWNGI